MLDLNLIDVCNKGSMMLATQYCTVYVKIDDTVLKRTLSVAINRIKQGLISFLFVCRVGITKVVEISSSYKLRFTFRGSWHIRCPHKTWHKFTLPEITLAHNTGRLWDLLQKCCKLVDRIITAPHFIPTVTGCHECGPRYHMTFYLVMQ